MLNSDQQKTLETIKQWYKGLRLFHIISGKGGTGKSFLVNEILKSLPKINPLILCPTHEALKQLKNKIEGDYDFKTVAASLGLRPTTHTKEIDFKHFTIPAFWENYNLCIVDECSMLSKEHIELLKSIGIKILFVGHKSQLPPVIKDRSLKDLCLAPIFEEGIQVDYLTIPQRNTGNLWDFCNTLDEQIYNEDRIVPDTFDIKTKELQEYLSSKEGIEDFIKEKSKIILWTNEGVKKFNQIIRNNIYGDYAKFHLYLPGDKIILTAPLTLIDNLEHQSEGSLKRLLNTELDSCFCNTKFKVLECEKISIKLNENLSIPCYKLKVVNQVEGTRVIYTPANFSSFEEISKYYEHIAWGFKDSRAKEKAFKERYFILNLFARVLHSYAGTTYRWQGSDINNVIIINSDIDKSNNMIERKKHRYVAASRVKENLMFYRGSL